MTHATPSGREDSQIDARTDRACDDFEDAWLAGQRPRIEDYLRQAPADAQGNLLRELLKVELAYRRGTGEEATPQDYFARFPDMNESFLIASAKASAVWASER